MTKGRLQGARGRRPRVALRAAILAAVLGAAAPGQSQEVSPELPAFGMLAVARGQSIELSLVLVGAQGPRHPGCSVKASQVGSDGRVLVDHEGNPIERTFQLHGNRAETHILRADDVLNAGAVRVATRVVLAPTSAVPSDCTCLMVGRAIVAPNASTVWSETVAAGRVNPPPPPPRVKPCQVPAFLTP